MHLERNPDVQEPFDFERLRREAETQPPAGSAFPDVTVENGIPDVIIEPDKPFLLQKLATSIWFPIVVLGGISALWFLTPQLGRRAEPSAAAVAATIDPAEDASESDDEPTEVAADVPNITGAPKNEPQHAPVPTPSADSLLVTAPVVDTVPKLMMDDLSPLPSDRIAEIPRRSQLGNRVDTKAITGEGPVPLDTALDRVSWEIAANLKEQKVLVIWLLDASGSQATQRRSIAKRFHQIYGDLQGGDRKEKGRRQDAPLLTGVVSFGEKTEFITPEPTADVQQIVKAVDTVNEDKTGVENVFGAVNQTLDRWLEFRTRRGRRIMLITITDEAGDDHEAQLDSAVQLAKKNGVRIYVLGPASVFGRRQGLMPYVHPMDGKTYQLPVDLGPETAVPEIVQLPFWYNGPQYEILSAGIGPYGLSRLVNETGGIYFMMQTSTGKVLDGADTFDGPNMKPFEPDYRIGTPEAFMKDLMKHPIRRAVVDAAERSQHHKAKGTPQLELRVNPNNFQQRLSSAQETVAVSGAMIDNILEAFSGKLEPEYQKDPSPRWRVAYDLALGRLLAQKVRCQEFNSACAQMKSIGVQEVATKSNHWKFVPDANLNYAAGMKKTASEAERLLKRVLEEAPDTPWATLAARELRDPFGIKVIQQFDPPQSVQVAEKPKRKKKVPPMDPNANKKAPPAKEAPREGTIILPKL